MQHKGLKIIERIEKIPDGSERVFKLVAIDEESLQTLAEILRIRLPIARNGMNRRQLLAFYTV